MRTTPAGKITFTHYSPLRHVYTWTALISRPLHIPFNLNKNLNLICDQMGHMETESYSFTQHKYAGDEGVVSWLT